MSPCNGFIVESVLSYHNLYLFNQDLISDLIEIKIHNVILCFATAILGAQNTVIKKMTKQTCSFFFLNDTSSSLIFNEKQEKAG